MKTKSLLMVLFAVFFGLMVSFVVTAKSFAAEAAAEDEWDEWGEEEEEEDAFGNIMQTTFATIDKVDFAAPAAGAPCSVTAKITFVDEDEEAKVTAVKLIYFLNGALDKPNSVDMAAGADGSYTGSIPGQPAGTNVDFIIRVEDSNANVTSQAVASSKYLIDSIPDMDNSQDIVGDDADILGVSAGYDSDYLYINFNVQGKISGGTVDPPYIQLYGIKITNPDTEQGEGLMVGKLWINLPLAKDQAVQNKFLPMLFEQGGDYVEKIGKDKIDRVMQTGMLVLDIQKLMGGNIMDGILFSAEPEGTSDGGNFVGKIKRAPLGDNPSGYLRIIVLTAANASIDSFMPIPLNCSNFLTLYTSGQKYTAAPAVAVVAAKPAAPVVSAPPVAAAAGTVSLGSQAIFDAGSASVKGQYKSKLTELAAFIKANNLEVVVEGYTDNLPTSGALYPTNWELSTGRSCAVVRYLISAGVPANLISAAGFGDTKPAASNTTADGRAKNRRAVIVLKATAKTPDGALQEAQQKFGAK